MNVEVNVVGLVQLRKYQKDVKLEIQTSSSSNFVWSVLLNYLKSVSYSFGIFIACCIYLESIGVRFGKKFEFKSYLS